MTHPIIRRFRELALVRSAKACVRLPFAMAATARERWSVSHPPPHELAVAAIFKDEAKNLAEWLTFHRGVGASHFYLYNNNSTDDFLTILRPWIANGLVTLIDWPIVPGQRAAYLHCLRTRWREAKWIAFIDIDEFLFSPAQVDIRPILRSYADVPALYVYSVRFGSSGHVTRPNMPVVQAYVRRAPFGIMDTGKSIVNPRFVRDVPNAHHFTLWRGRTVDAKRRRTQSPRGKPAPDRMPVYDLLRINHYFYKSREDLLEKTKRGDAFYGLQREFDRDLQWDDIANSEEDCAILSIWQEIVRADRLNPAFVGTSGECQSAPNGRRSNTGRSQS